MTVSEIERQWGKLRLREVPSGSDSRAFAPICADPMRGWARFWNGSLMEIHFVGGARTDRGIGIGSTRQEVKRAYGASLQPRKRSDSLMLLGRNRFRYSDSSARDVIVFVFKGRRIHQIIFGWRDEINEGRDTSGANDAACMSTDGE